MSTEAKTLELLEKLDTEIKGYEKQIKESNDKMHEEIKKYGGVSAQTKKDLEEVDAKHLKAMQDVRGEFEELKKRADEMEAKFLRQPTIGALVGLDGKPLVRPGEIVTSHDNFKEFQKNIEQKGIMDRVALGKMSDILITMGMVHAQASGQKDLVGSDVARPILSVVNQTPIFAPPLLRRQHMRNYLKVIKTNRRVINYVQEQDFDNQAAARAEGAAANLSSLTLVDKSEQGRIISHGMVMTRQEAEDMPTVQTHIEGRLMNGILHVEDDYILNSDGVSGSNMFTGILNEDIQAYDRYQSGDTKIDTLRRAITQLQLAYLFPNLNVVNVEDWEEIELTKDGQERYLWVEVTIGGEQRMWRVPVFPTTAIEKGTFLSGDFYLGATLWDRESVFVQIFNQHADFALKGKLLLMAEEQLTLTVEVPQAFVGGSYTGTGS